MMSGAKAIVVLLLVAIAVAFVLVRVDSDDGARGWVDDARRADSALLIRAASRRVWSATQWDSVRSARVFPSKHIELNGADSMTLCSVYGIGRVFSSRIMARRVELGGFHSLEQLMEVRGITKEVYYNISSNFWLDSTVIQKISINFASLNVLMAHPYCTPSMARRIEKGRMKGGFCNTKELTERDILLPKEARRLAPYLSFDK